ncbi:unnamed protein product [Meloidogyne enterolobii]|uniref:Uncharacterized protein n=1 Tax=Meloidogyne enterolobii TaxID=390850 RepID=A0ACB1AB24_MELEN
MEVNKIDEVFSEYKIEIIYEIDENNKNDYVYTSFGPPYDCNEPDQNAHKIKRIINGTNGKKLILFEGVEYVIKLKKLNICLIEYSEISEIEEKVDFGRLKRYRVNQMIKIDIEGLKD